MDVNAIIQKLKKEPGFTENVGMVLAHNGVVRAWSREGRAPVQEVDVSTDMNRIEALRKEYEKKPGIFRVAVEAAQGKLKPGDDLLVIVVAGDLRENVKPVLAELLDRIKAEAVSKTETAA